MYVYIIKCANYYKIGHSKNPNQRRAAIQTHNPLDVRICAKLKTEDAVFIEKQLHGKFTGRRSRGEWFELKEDDLKLLQIDYGFTFKIPISKIFDDDRFDNTEGQKETKSIRLSNKKFNEVKVYFEDVFDCEILNIKLIKSCCVKYSNDVIYTSINNLLNQNYDANKALNSLEKFCSYEDKKRNDPVQYMWDIIKSIYYKHYDWDLNCNLEIFESISPILENVPDVDFFMKDINRQKYYNDEDELLDYILQQNKTKITS